MASDDGIIASCHELSPGDAVTDTAPENGLRILDTVTGARRLLDISAFMIVPIPRRCREGVTGRRHLRVPDRAQFL